MSEDDGIWIIGAGGHAKVVLATAHAAGLTVSGLIDQRPETHGTQILGVFVVGDSGALPPSAICVAAVGDTQSRRRIVTEELPNVRWRSVVHPHAELAEGTSLGVGTVVFASAVVQPGSSLGDHVIVNTSAVIEHENEIGDFVHLATGALLTGGVKIGVGSFIGAGAVVLPGIRIGAWCTVGAGAVVTHDVPDGATVKGVPARP